MMSCFELYENEAECSKIEVNMTACSSKLICAEELVDILQLDPDKSLPIVIEDNSKCNLNHTEEFCSSFVPLN